MQAKAIPRRRNLKESASSSTPHLSAYYAMLSFCGSLLRNLTFLKNKWRIGSAPGLLLSQEGVALRD